MPRIRAVVFDIGGTLIYPADPVGETYAKFARSHGVKLDAEATTAAFLEAFKGAPPRKDSVPTNGDDRAWWKEVVRRSLPEAAFGDKKAFETFFEDVYVFYGKPDAWGVYPEVQEVLEALRDYDVDLVALTNWDARLHAVLDGLGLGEYINRRFISAEIGWEKPDPAIYRHVAEILRLSPTALLSVGDDAKNDVEGPKKAGWQTVQIERPKRDLWAVIKALTGKKK